jgi:plastocyanin
VEFGEASVFSTVSKNVPLFKGIRREKMKRLSFIALCTVIFFAVGFTAYLTLAQEKHQHIKESRSDSDNDNQLNNATVSFGGWMTTPALSRFPNLNPFTANHHALTPKTVKIKAGGTVNFIIGGFHEVLVYDNGTQPGDINTTLTVPPTNGGPPLINDPNRRIYRGLDPSLQPQDRVEVVQFDRPGLYLVICGVRPHFVNDGMYGFVRVTGGKDDDDDDDVGKK